MGGLFGDRRQLVVSIGVLRREFYSGCVVAARHDECSWPQLRYVVKVLAHNSYYPVRQRDDHRAAKHRRLRSASNGPIVQALAVSYAQQLSHEAIKIISQ